MLPCIKSSQITHLVSLRLYYISEMHILYNRYENKIQIQLGINLFSSKATTPIFPVLYHYTYITSRVSHSTITLKPGFLLRHQTEAIFLETNQLRPHLSSHEIFDTNISLQKPSLPLISNCSLIPPHLSMALLTQLFFCLQPQTMHPLFSPWLFSLQLHFTNASYAQVSSSLPQNVTCPICLLSSCIFSLYFRMYSQLVSFQVVFYFNSINFRVIYPKCRLDHIIHLLGHVVIFHDFHNLCKLFSTDDSPKILFQPCLYPQCSVISVRILLSRDARCLIIF